MDAEQALVMHLLNDSALTALVGDRVFPLAIPQDEQVPAIVYQKISAPRTLSVSGDSSANSTRMQLSCYAETFGQAKQIAQVLYNSVDVFRGQLGGRVKAAVLMADSRDDYEPDTGRYRCDIDFFVMHHKQKGE